MTSALLHLEGARWRTPRPGVYLAGRVFEGTRPLDDDAVAHRLQAIATPGGLATELAGWNGFFAVALGRPSGTLAAVDRVRSIPLFFGHDGPTLVLSDGAEWVRRRLDEVERDPLAVEEFLHTGYVTGGDTLFARVRQLQAGEALFVRDPNGDRSIETVRYARFVRSEHERSHDELLAGLDAATEAAIDRLLVVADGRSIVLPLSGGLDSRVLAVALADRRYPDLRAFTYGKPGNAESAVSREIANRLGIPWHFVPYSIEAWGHWSATDEFQTYLHDGHLHASVPVVQDWPAVRELTRTGAIPPGSLIVPGHTGDFTAGDHTLRAFVGAGSVTAHALANAVYERHYGLWPTREGPGMHRMLVDRILDRMDVASTARMPGHRAIAAHDTWNWQERQAKFIVNSVRAYEHLGHDWWLPLWDTELVTFWEAVPLPWRLGARLHHDHVAARYAATAGVPVVATPAKRWRYPLVEIARSVAHASPLAWAARRAARWDRRRTEYDAHPLAWYGILDRPTFRRRYTGRETINSFIAELLIESAPDAAGGHPT